jgi:cytoskeletal protein RodZ
MSAMENKNDIGKALREKLDLLDKTPGDHVWEGIEAELDRKKKRRVLPFWLRLFVVALILVSAFFMTEGTLWNTGQGKSAIENQTGSGHGNAAGGESTFDPSGTAPKLRHQVKRLRPYRTLEIQTFQIRTPSHSMKTANPYRSLEKHSSVEPEPALMTTRIQVTKNRADPNGIASENQDA